MPPETPDFYGGLFPGVPLPAVNDPADPPEDQLVYCGDVPTHADASPTEAAAADSVRAKAPALRMEILELIRAAGDEGMTDKELGRWYARKLGRHDDDAAARYSAAPRRVELRDGGFVEDSGRVRERAIVWIATSQPGDGRVCSRVSIPG